MANTEGTNRHALDFWTLGAWLLLPTLFALCLVGAVTRQPLWLRQESAKRTKQWLGVPNKI